MAATPDESMPEPVIDLTITGSHEILAQGDELLRSSRDLLDELDDVMAGPTADF